MPVKKTKKKSRAIKVLHRKPYKKTKEWGYALWWKNQITLDRSMKKLSYKYMNVFIHECLHVMEPLWSESRINREAARLTKTLWKNGFRKII